MFKNNKVEDFIGNNIDNSKEKLVQVCKFLQNNNWECSFCRNEFDNIKDEDVKLQRNYDNNFVVGFSVISKFEDRTENCPKCGNKL